MVWWIYDKRSKKVFYFRKFKTLLACADSIGEFFVSADRRFTDFSRKLSQTQKKFHAFVSLLLLIVVSIAIFEFSYHVSETFPWLPLNFTLSFLMYLIAAFLQGKDIKRHFYLNFGNASWLKTLGWTFICYVTKFLILLLITAFVMLS